MARRRGRTYRDQLESLLERVSDTFQTPAEELMCSRYREGC